MNNLNVKEAGIFIGCPLPTYYSTNLTTKPRKRIVSQNGFLGRKEGTMSQIATPSNGTLLREMYTAFPTPDLIVRLDTELRKHAALEWRVRAMLGVVLGREDYLTPVERLLIYTALVAAAADKFGWEIAWKNARPAAMSQAGA